MTLEAGWLAREFSEVEEDVKSWPDWMKKASKFGNTQDKATDELERSQSSTCAIGEVPERAGGAAS